MKILSFTVEDVYWVSQVLSILLLAGTVLLGGVALFTGKVLNDRQAMQLEEQRQRATEAQLSLLALQRFVREPRTVNPIKSKALLENRPKGSVEIKYLHGIETERLAHELQQTLEANGWKVSIQKVASDVIHDAGIALLSGSKTSPREGLDESGRPKFFEEPGQTLFAFLDSCVEGTIGGWSMTNPNLESNTSVVLIGPKVW